MIDASEHKLVWYTTENMMFLVKEIAPSGGGAVILVN
jgi:hypothetical protein